MKDSVDTRDTLDRLFEAGLAAGADRTALSRDARRYSFADLDALSDRLAARLAGLAAGAANPRFVVIAEKDPAIVVAGVGIWKAGGVYVPTDAFDAPERLRHVLTTIAPTAVLSSQARLMHFAEVLGDLPRVSYEEILADDSAAPRPEAPQSAQDPAIIIHTSGSTGRPKGTILSHGSVTTYFRNHNAIMGFTPASVGMSNGPFHFDVSVQDTYLPLFFGARVVMHNDLFLSSKILRLMAREGVTHLIAVSSVLELISADDATLAAMGDTAPHTVITGGELCDPELINRWLRHYPDLKLNYGYGPTECNSLCMSYRVTAPDPGRTVPFPIGTVFPGHKAVLLDDAGDVIEVPETVGVLCISGPQLMSGYWKNPEQTDAVLREIDGARFYVTGDRCWRDAEGLYHFASRRDTEVKILGRRINLMEIRDALLADEAVRYAVVGTAQIGGQTQIHAFVQVTEAEADPAAILAGVERHVPQYMVPRVLSRATAMPRTSTGKVAEKVILDAAEAAIALAPEARFHILDFAPAQEDAAC